MNGRIFRNGFVVFLCFCGWAVTSDSFAQSESTESDGSDAASAQPDDEKGTKEEKELLNAFSFGVAYAFQLNRNRDSATTGEPLRTRESLGGFVIAYERELLPKRLSLGMSKPFYFLFNRVDTPFELVLKGLFHRGSW